MPGCMLGWVVWTWLGRVLRTTVPWPAMTGVPEEDQVSGLGSEGFLVEGMVSRMGNRCVQAAEKLSCVGKEGIRHVVIMKRGLVMLASSSEQCYCQFTPRTEEVVQEQVVR